MRNADKRAELYSEHNVGYSTLRTLTNRSFPVGMVPYTSFILLDMDLLGFNFFFFHQNKSWDHPPIIEDSRT